METTTNNTQDTILEGTKTANKWFNDSANAMTDLYKKQLEATSNFYNNFFNLFSEDNKNVFNPARSFTDLFLNTGNYGGMKFNNPFSNGGMNGNFSNIFASSLNRVFKQMAEFNQNLSSAIGKQLENGGADWNSINEKYQRLMESRLEALKKIMNTIVQANNKQIELTMEANRNLQEEITAQMSFLNKQNQKFWTDILNLRNQAAESERPSKDGSANEKKQSKSVVEVG
jgi:hypothetical protein